EDHALSPARVGGEDVLLEEAGIDGVDGRELRLHLLALLDDVRLLAEPGGDAHVGALDDVGDLPHQRLVPGPVVEAEVRGLALAPLAELLFERLGEEPFAVHRVEVPDDLVAAADLDEGLPVAAEHWLDALDAVARPVSAGLEPPVDDPAEGEVRLV